MKDNIYAVLSKLSWILFFLFIFLNIVNWAFTIKDGVFQRSLPFSLEDGKSVGIQDSTMAAILENKEIVKIDTLDITRFKGAQERSGGPQLMIFQTNLGEIETDDLDIAIEDVLRGKQTVEIAFQDSLNLNTYIVDTIPNKDYTALINVGFNALFLLFIFFNSYLLLRYSQAKENILIVLFLLLL